MKFWAILIFFVAAALINGGWLFKLNSNGIPVKNAIFYEKGELNKENFVKLDLDKLGIELESGKVERILVIKKDEEADKKLDVTLYGKELFDNKSGSNAGSMEELLLQFVSGSGNAYAIQCPSPKREYCDVYTYNGVVYRDCECR